LKISRISAESPRRVSPPAASVMARQRLGVGLGAEGDAEHRDLALPGPRDSRPPVRRA
jgi:hypothetical protein